MGHDVEPAYVRDALAKLSIMTEDEARQLLDRFERRWGEIDARSLARALNQGDGDDQLFAICAVRYLDSPDSRTMLLPLLQCPNAIVRSAAAVCLAELGDQRAYPALARALKETTIAEHDVRIPSVDRNEIYWKIYAVTLIGGLCERAFMPALRAALVAAEAQLRRYDAASGMQRTAVSAQTDMQYPGAATGPGNTQVERSWLPINDAVRDLLIEYEDEIVYTLGRLGGFGGLAGIPVPEETMLVWMVHTIMGHLHGRFSWEVLAGRDLDSAFEAEVKRLLAQQFGLDDGTSERALDMYLRLKIGMLLIRWQLNAQHPVDSAAPGRID